MAEWRNVNTNLPSENALASPQLLHSIPASIALNSGFDYEFVDKLDSKYECSICLLALRNPVQTKCGHRFCHDCIKSCISDCRKECPIDKQPLNENALFHDSCIEREILQLKVKCPNASLGCKSHVDLRYVEDHMHACVYQPVLCPNECSVTILQKELDEHLANHCLFRLTKCKFCDKTFHFNHGQLHSLECPLVSVPCDLCGQEIQRCHLAEHKNGSCLYAEVSCTFSEHGCQFRSSRGNMKKHIAKSLEYHIQLLSAAYKKINTLVLDLYRNIGQVASGTFTRQPSLRSQHSQTSVADGHSSPTPNTIDHSIIIGSNGNTSSHINHFFPHHFEDFRPESELKHAQNAVLESECRESEDPKRGFKKGDFVVDEKTFLKNLSDKYVDLDQKLTEETIRIDNVIRRVEILESSLRHFTYDANAKFSNGTLVWKIPNFTEISRQMEKKNKIYHSPPFYTSQFGYKFCLRSNVTVSSEDSFLTLYLHLMQSENDDFLNFPFQGRIVLSLLDCRDSMNKQHFTETMEVTGIIDAFKKPSTTRSIKGYGYKEFISLQQIFSSCNSCEYLKNDSLYIKAIVSVK